MEGDTNNPPHTNNTTGDNDMTSILTKVRNTFLAPFTLEQSLTKGGKLSKTLTVIRRSDGRKVGTLTPAGERVTIKGFNGPTLVTDSVTEVEWRLKLNR